MQLPFASLALSSTAPAVIWPRKRNLKAQEKEKGTYTQKRGEKILPSSAFADNMVWLWWKEEEKRRQAEEEKECSFCFSSLFADIYVSKWKSRSDKEKEM